MTNSFQLCAFGEPVGDWRSPNDTNTVLEQGIRGASLRNDVWTVTVAGALLLWLSDYRDAWSDWRRNGWKVWHVNRGSLEKRRRRYVACSSGVRAPIVALKRRNGRGAKGWAGRWMGVG